MMQEKGRIDGPLPHAAAWRCVSRLAVLLLLSQAACANPEPTVTASSEPEQAADARRQQPTTAPALTVGERIVEVPRKLLEGALDPTGVRSASTDIGRASDELAKKLRDLDIDGLNATIWQLQETIGVVRTHINSLPLDLGTDVKAQIRAARLEEIPNQIQAIGNDVRAKVDAIRIDQLNDAVAAIGATVKRIDAKVAELDMAAVNKLVGRTQTSVDETNVTLGTTGMPLRVSLWLVNVVLVGLIACIAIWLRRMIRAKA